MGNWVISPKATEKEKIKAEMADFLQGLNATGDVSYATYSEIFDVSMGLFDKIYELGKEEGIYDSKITHAISKPNPKVQE